MKEHWYKNISCT